MVFDNSLVDDIRDVVQELWDGFGALNTNKPTIFLDVFIDFGSQKSQKSKNLDMQMVSEFLIPKDTFRV